MSENERPRLLDLFCGAGGATCGYVRAGFDVVGVDHKPQKNYLKSGASEFIQADALEYCREHGAEFDAIHASPPCQRYSECTPIANRDGFPDMIAETRNAIERWRRPYIIENVDCARALLDTDIMLCGTMFGLHLHRHRWFEVRPDFLALLPKCRRIRNPVLVNGRTRGRRDYTPAQMIDAMRTPWMVLRKEVREAIPPAYTEYIGRQLIEIVRKRATT